MRKKIIFVLMTFLFMLLPLVSVNATANDSEVKDGDIKEGEITEGKFKSPGDVQVTKRVTKENDAGLYKVEFEIKGLKSPENLPAGTNATLIDTIGENFEFVEDSQSAGVTYSNKVVTFEFDEITEEGTIISFNIQIDINKADGWNDTNVTSNKGVKLSYTDNKNKPKEMAFNKTAKVYWVKKYSYTINYYQDSLTGKLLGTKTGIAPKDTLIETVDLTLFLLSGYKFKESNLPYKVLKDQENVINVIYEKRNDLSYKVEYYYDGVLDESKTYIVNNVTYGSVITEFIDKSGPSYLLKSCSDLTIGLEENVLKVYYEKIKMASNEIIPPKTGIIDNSSGFISIISSSIVLLFLLRRKM